jgi:hypothetical protein
MMVEVVRAGDEVDAPLVCGESPRKAEGPVLSIDVEPTAFVPSD